MLLADRLPATSTRVERSTDPPRDQAIRGRADAEIACLEGADAGQFAERLRQLDAEWGVERALEVNASALVLVGLALGERVDRRFLLLSAGVFTFLAQHALQGWCPPLPVMRALGLRSLHEIERERYAVKALRGDFDQVPPAGAADRGSRVRAALAAVDA